MVFSMEERALAGAFDRVGCMFGEAKLIGRRLAQLELVGLKLEIMSIGSLGGTYKQRHVWL